MKKFVEKIKYLEEKYAEKVGENHLREEKEILNLKGKEYFTPSELQKIIKWKNRRDRYSKRNLKKKVQVQEITSKCFKKLKNKEEDPSTIKQVLDCFIKELDGVGIPVASAILMAYNPEKFTPIDWRVWNALFLLCELDRPYPKNLKKDDYIEYLRTCRKLARKLNVDLRTLDRALWIASHKYQDC